MNRWWPDCSKASSTRCCSARPGPARRSPSPTSSPAAQRPALILAHNKTLAAQLYAEFKDFFPENAVEYFVSYYDYYQPEAYVPRHDLYIEKETEVNEEIERLRLSATTSVISRRDVIVVASVSCIYGIGNPDAYGSVVVELKVGGQVRRNAVLRQLVESQYERNDMDLHTGAFRVRGDTLEVIPAYDELGLRISFFGDEIERIVQFDRVTGEILARLDEVSIYPAKHFITEREKLDAAMVDIEAELAARLAHLRSQDKLPRGTAAGPAHALRPGNAARGRLLRWN